MPFLSNILLIKESGKKNVFSIKIVFNNDYKKCYLISEGSCDTEDWSNAEHSVLPTPE